MINTREEFPELLNSINAKIGVELGVLKGDFSKLLLEKWNGNKLYLIDHWSHITGLIDANNGEHNIQLDNFAHTFMNTYFHFDKCCIIKETSKDASKLFQDNSLDFIYIDAAHDFKNVTEDLKTWFPKVKKGGIISGHDYATAVFFGKNENIKSLIEVKRAVDDFFIPLNYEIFSTKEHLPSWWVIK